MQEVTDIGLVDTIKYGVFKKFTIIRLKKYVSIEVNSKQFSKF